MQDLRITRSQEYSSIKQRIKLFYCGFAKVAFLHPEEVLYTGIMYKLNSILVFSENSKKLAEFYKKIFEAEPSWTNGEYFEFKAGNVYFEVGPHDKVKGQSVNPERVILNFHVKDVEKEFNKLKKLGVTVIKEPYKPKEDPRLTIATFADPDGNYFQLMTAWEDFK